MNLVIARKVGFMDRLEFSVHHAGCAENSCISWTMDLDVRFIWEKTTNQNHNKNSIKQKTPNPFLLIHISYAEHNSSSVQALIVLSVDSRVREPEYK